MSGTAQDAGNVDLVNSLSLSLRQAAVDDGLVERLESFQGVGPAFGVLAEVIEEAGMSRAESLELVLSQLPGEVLPDERVGVDWDFTSLRTRRCPVLILRETQLDEAGLIQAVDQGTPLVIVQRHKPVGEAVDGRLRAQGLQAIRTGGTVEQAHESQRLQILRIAVGRLQPILVGIEHVPGIAGPGFASLVGFFQLDGVALADIAALGDKQIAPEQDETESVTGVVLGRLAQIVVASGNLQVLQKADGDLVGQLLQIVISRRLRAQIAQRLATGHHAETGILHRQNIEQFAQIGIGDLSGLRVIERILQWLQPVEHQQRAMLLHEPSQPRALARRVGIFVAEKLQPLFEKRPDTGRAGLVFAVRARSLIVKGPVEVEQRIRFARLVLPLLGDEGLLHPLRQQGGLADATPSDDAKDIHRLCSAPGLIQQSQLRLAPEKVLRRMAVEAGRGDFLGDLLRNDAEVIADVPNDLGTTTFGVLQGLGVAASEVEVVELISLWEVFGFVAFFRIDQHIDATIQRQPGFPLKVSELCAIAEQGARLRVITQEIVRRCVGKKFSDSVGVGPGARIAPNDMDQQIAIGDLLVERAQRVRR